MRFDDSSELLSLPKVGYASGQRGFRSHNVSLVSQAPDLVFRLDADVPFLDTKSQLMIAR